MIDLREVADLRILIQPEDSKIRNIAFGLGNIRDIFLFVRDEIVTYPDIGEGDEWLTSTSVLERGKDDCEGKSSLLVSLLRVIGYDAVVYIFGNRSINENHAVVVLRDEGFILDPTYKKMGFNELSSVFVDGFYGEPICAFDEKELVVYDERRYERLL